MSHDHDHAPANFGKAFAIGITLNLAFVLIEGFYGWRAGSLALLADAAHNLSDVGGLLLAWAAFAAARLKTQFQAHLWLAARLEFGQFCQYHPAVGGHGLTSVGSCSLAT